MPGELDGFSFKKPPEREVTSTPTNQVRLFDHHFFLWENGIISFLIRSSRAQRSCMKISTYRSCSIRNVFWKIKRGKYKPEVTGIEKEHHLVGGFNPIWNICSSRSFPQIVVENSKNMWVATPFCHLHQNLRFFCGWNPHSNLWSDLSNHYLRVGGSKGCGMS